MFKGCNQVKGERDELVWNGVLIDTQDTSSKARSYEEMLMYKCYTERQLCSILKSGLSLLKLH